MRQAGQREAALESTCEKPRAPATVPGRCPTDSRGPKRCQPSGTKTTRPSKAGLVVTSAAGIQLERPPAARWSRRGRGGGAAAMADDGGASDSAAEGGGAGGDGAVAGSDGTAVAQRKSFQNQVQIAERGAVVRASRISSARGCGGAIGIMGTARNPSSSALLRRSVDKAGGRRLIGGRVERCKLGGGAIDGQ